ncbi:Fe-S biogenesis protein NfuA [Dasania sp. GY-MA-18]|uniref:Fe/S biogenesis protein NfuA n=1 Tax=Dasania phycosphaerae TaxID=2950436 RepID=A0A9J6RIA6_9GAMM|nr:MULTISPECIES: Fe-S biogenesis protein NfuA [Dasania]MCR8921767.1 Fe-S biogenesis protein NfuA [Dasania sp. GY-MA-18]MCZ0864195.1 Fe-S biogenesis protein NfuA [Dasania phycosphaerae]MCZ0867923.1 Fe-S biogenesis protein NfuA [Dasania phycosphaerae]
MSEANPELKLTITESAQAYLAELLAGQDEEVKGIRLFISQPGTPKAETCIAYCREDDEQDDDIIVQYENLLARVELRSVPFLEDAFVDYAKDRMGGQLTIKAPNAKLPKVNENSSIEDQINYVLYNEVNPSLAAHGGEVSLVEVAEEDDKKIAVLRFGGGCQGCGMVDMTLKDGVEKSLLEQVPGLAAVRDMTDHTDTSQAYFK